MKVRNFITTENDLVYKILSYEEKKYSRVRRGTIERLLSNDPHPEGWLLHYTDYHVTVRNKNENFDRIFVLTEQEAKEELFYE